MAGKRIIVSRTDSIGDVMLTLPLCGYLKEQFPDCHLYFLGRTYTIPVLECCSHIDEILDFTEIEKNSLPGQVDFFKDLKADIIIHVFPNKQIAKISSLARIPERIGSSGRMFHWNTCTSKVFFSRKNSSLHEAQLNFKLLRPLGLDKIPELNEINEYSGFKNIHPLPAFLQSKSSMKRYILHPKSKGSAAEWGIENFNQLIRLLSAENCEVLISGTQAEKELIKDNITLVENTVDLSGKLDLKSFIALIDSCEGLVAASTGPLHIASAMGKKAIGLYSNRRPIHPGRWAPVGTNSRAITYDGNSLNQFADEDIKKIKPELIKDLLLIHPLP